MTYNVLVEGQTIPVPEEIGASDEAVKRALSPFYPEVANALITRVEKDGVTTINVVKRAGSKGLSGAAYLAACPGGKNAAVALLEEIEAAGDVDPLAFLEMGERIEAAISQGEKEAEAVEAAGKRLAKAAARPAQFVMRGF